MASFDKNAAIAFGVVASAVAFGKLWQHFVADRRRRLASEREPFGQCLEQLLRRRPSERRKKYSIKLVGGGPGNPDLLTVAALRAIREADVLLCDRLVPESILSLVPATVDVRIAGKKKGRADAVQNALCESGLEALKEGLRVVRLKGGDPFVFGRGGEEVAFFRSHGYEPEVIPGISSSLAAPLWAGIPVTMRGVADRFVVCTGMGRGGAETELPVFCAHQTLVLLMSVGRLRRISQDQLIGELGYPADLPVAIIERGTTPHQRVVVGSLSSIADIAAANEISSPATIVVGAVAGVERA